MKFQEDQIQLDLIKEHDPRGERSVGILTKIDLKKGILMVMTISI